MKYQKLISDGYIAAVGEFSNGTEISRQEYENIMAVILSKPSSPEGYAYKLRADDLEWELVELPPVEETDLTADEALDIILGGGGE